MLVIYTHRYLLVPPRGDSYLTSLCSRVSVVNLDLVGLIDYSICRSAEQI